MKGICKISLQTGCPIVPVYGFGHTTLWTVIADPFGILEKLSVYLNVSICPFYGRFGCVGALSKICFDFGMFFFNRIIDFVFEISFFPPPRGRLVAKSVNIDPNKTKNKTLKTRKQINTHIYYINFYKTCKYILSIYKKIENTY